MLGIVPGNAYVVTHNHYSDHMNRGVYLQVGDIVFVVSASLNGSTHLLDVTWCVAGLCGALTRTSAQILPRLFACQKRRIIRQ